MFIMDESQSRSRPESVICSQIASFRFSKNSLSAFEQPIPLRCGSNALRGAVAIDSEATEEMRDYRRIVRRVSSGGLRDRAAYRQSCKYDFRYGGESAARVPRLSEVRVDPNSDSSIVEQSRENRDPHRLGYPPNAEPVEDVSAIGFDGPRAEPEPMRNHLARLADRYAFEHVALTVAELSDLVDRLLPLRIVACGRGRYLEARDELEQVGHRIGLLQELGGAELHRFDRETNVTVAGEEYDVRQVRRRGPESAQRLEAVQARHHDIEKEDVGTRGNTGLDQRRSAFERRHPMARDFEKTHRGIPDCRVVLDDEDEAP